MKTLIVGMAAIAAAPATAFAAWTVDTTASELGAPTWIAMVTSNGPVLNTIGMPERAKLVLRCRGSLLEVFVDWPAYLGLVGRKPVRWKFDDGPVQSDNYWGVSKDGKALFYDKLLATDTYDFAKQITHSSKLVFGTSSYQKAEEEVVFDLTGAKELAQQSCLKGMLD